ncbi:hypothetical protein ElyMa_006726100 [Elysia marginata]|uniref:Uncharacterized protein n=1 Tax=Elysia marginata TaxID=1093978 RepID=A0AAV4IWI7_9GAST|nr:hypothetical protein ElyMa_006726100 [Elysia marginata]
MHVGNAFLAQCDAQIGYAGTMVLIMYINDTLIRYSDEKLGIRIVSAGVPHGGYETMLLTAERMSPTLNGMRIACFSYDINAYPNKYFQCHPLDELCTITEPIQVIYDIDMVLTFGQGKCTFFKTFTVFAASSSIPFTPLQGRGHAQVTAIHCGPTQTFQADPILFPSLSFSSLHISCMWSSVALWLGRPTCDPAVAGSIPTTRHVVTALGMQFIHIFFSPPTCEMGTGYRQCLKCVE